jgi:peptidoglycan hydrolase-like protein with peptidoglycan-binding domain
MHMSKKILIVGAIAIFAMPFFGSAQTTSISSLQQQIQALLATVNELQNKLNNIQPSILPNYPPPSPDSSTLNSCADATFRFNMYLGIGNRETDGEVSKLQLFLKRTGDFTHPEITGYFGPATEMAVKKWQARNGVVSSGSPDTTGYGVVGPKTREVMRVKGCGGSIINPINQDGIVLGAGPISGEAPLKVGFNAAVRDNYSLYYLTLGDGTVISNFAIAMPGCPIGWTNCNDVTLSTFHTYQRPGTYKAALHKKYICDTSAGLVCPAVYSTQVAEKTITVKEPAIIYPQHGLVVTAPQSGETLNPMGKDVWVRIKWASVGLGTLGINIDLYNQNGTFAKRIATNVPNTGDYAWRYDSYEYDPVIKTGNYYLVLATNDCCKPTAETKSGIFQMVNQAPTPSLSVTSPQSGAVLNNVGKDVWTRVQWASVGLGTLGINIDLYNQNGTFAKRIATNVPNTGDYAWRYDSYEYDPVIKTGNYYLVLATNDCCKPTAETKSGIFQMVNQASTITITSPANNQIYYVNSTLPIRWHGSVQGVDQLSVHLISYKGGRTEIYNIGTAVVSSGWYDWIIPSWIIQQGGLGHGYAIELRGKAYSTETPLFTIW